MNANPMTMRVISIEKCISRENFNYSICSTTNDLIFVGPETKDAFIILLGMALLQL